MLNPTQVKAENTPIAGVFFAIVFSLSLEYTVIDGSWGLHQNGAF